MAAPGYVETNGRVSIPSRLRPAQGGALDVVLMPRPPLSAASLANANQTAAASVNWLDDDGTGHLEPLWVSQQPHTFANGWTLVSGDESAFAGIEKLVIEPWVARPGHVGWDSAYTFDVPQNSMLVNPYNSPASYGLNTGMSDIGQLAPTYGPDDRQPLVLYEGAPTTIYLWAFVGPRTAPTAVATKVHVVPTGDQPPVPVRNRATLGDLVGWLDGSTLTLTEITPNEIDITGVVPPVVVPPEPEPVPVSVYASEAELNAILGREPSAHDERTVGALVAASRWVDYRIGVDFTDDPITSPVAITVVPSTAAIHAATLVAAVRFYKGPDVPFGVAGQDLTAYVRTGIPDAELALLGQRQSFGIA
jgi:hypothetical protein